MSNLGMGVMIGMLGGNEETVKAFQESKGKTIKDLKLVDDRLRFTFEDGSVMVMYDDGQSCCEYRYMTTDDDLSAFIGATLEDAEIREGPTVEDEYGDPHEMEFLLITTSSGVFTMETHNIHNGYYGGFWVIARIEQAAIDAAEAE